MQEIGIGEKLVRGLENFKKLGFDKCYAVFTVIILQLSLSPLIAARAESYISILMPEGFVNQKFLKDFELSSGVKTRVELVSSSLELEQRLRASPRVWDVVIDQHSMLFHLAHAKLFKPLPDALTSESARPKTQKFWNENLNLGQEATKYIQPLVVNPWGLLWKEKSLPKPESVSWHQLAQLDKASQWRARVLRPETESLLLQIMTLLFSPYGSSLDKKIQSLFSQPALSWLFRFDKQVQPFFENFLQSFLSENVSVAITTQWQATKMNRLIPSTEFQVPTEGTLFGYFGVAVPEDSVRSDKALLFVNFCKLNVNDIISQTGLLDFNKVQGKKNWRLFDEYFTRSEKIKDLTKLPLDNIHF